MNLQNSCTRRRVIRLCSLLLLQVFFLSVFAQGNELTVKGTVKDVKGEPLSMVNVFIKGTTNGTLTDEKGGYMLKVASATSATLVFSYISFVAQEIPVKNKTQIDVRLLEDTKSIDEVVFVGYGALKKSSVATAVASVKPEDFNTGGSKDPLNLLEGKVAGLTITRAGGNNPNSSSSIQMRGITSLIGSTSPLIVIDGIPGGNLDLVQPNDIESMEVLKDGSAAAIYGSKANAGVILINTKKGKSGVAQFEYASYYTHYTLKKRPNYMTGEEYRAYLNNPNNPNNTRLIDYGHNTDFYDALLNHSNLSQYQNIAISGGSENMNYRGSVYFSDLNGIAKQNGRQEYGARVSLSNSVFENKLKTQINMVTNYNNANLLGGSGWQSSLERNPTQNIYKEDGSWWEDPETTNQVARLAQESSKRIQSTSSIDGRLTFAPTKDLNLSVFASSQRNGYVDNVYQDIDSKASVTSGDYPNAGLAKKSSYLSTDYIFEPTMSYQKTLQEKHSINAIAGYSYQYSVEESFEATNAGFINDLLQENDLAAGTYLAAGKAKMSSKKIDETLIAFFGRINYAFNNRYIIQASLRREGSSKFGANHKWGNFPSLSTAWNISNESFMENHSYISNLKLRAGYGVTGNSGIANYLSLVKLETGESYLNPNGTYSPTYGPSSNPNPNLRWEQKAEFNIGIDFGIFKNRIGGSIDYYKRRTTDLIESYVTQSPPYVLPFITANVGTISNSGLEVSLNFIPISKKHLVWRSDLLLSASQNTLESFSNDLYKIPYREYSEIGGYGSPGNAIRTYEGDKLGNFFGRRYAGLDKDGEWLFYNKQGEKVGSDQIKDEDKTILGNAIPKYNLSWSNHIKYKNFDFTIAFRGKFGFQILNQTDYYDGNIANLPHNILNNATTRHPGLNASPQWSDYYLEDGDFIKLDNLTIGYNFNRDKTKISAFRIYLTGRDLLTFTNYTGLDPEVQDTGLGDRRRNVDSGRGLGLESVDRYPVTSSFTLGINITF